MVVPVNSEISAVWWYNSLKQRLRTENGEKIWTIKSDVHQSMNKNPSIFCVLGHLVGNFVLIFCHYKLCKWYIWVDFVNIFNIIKNAWNILMKKVNK